MKKILLIIDNLGSGGAQNQITMLALLLKAEGYFVDIFYYHSLSFYKYRLDKAEIPLFLIEKSTKFGSEVLYSLIKILHKNDYYATISFLTTPNFYNVIARFFSLSKNKTIISYRSRTNIPNLSLMHRVKHRIINRLADYVVFNSYHELNNWLKYQPILKSKSMCIYNIVDMDLFIQRQSYQRKYNLLVVGSIGPDKNGLLVIDALAKIRLKLDVRLTWIGQKIYTLADRKTYLEEMESAIHNNNLNCFWQWIEPSKDIHELYQNFDALVLASKVEGLPNVVCEALSTGTPVIISNVLDHPILVTEGVNGFLFDPDNSDSLANAVKSLYSLSENDYCKMGENARKYSEINFNRNIFINGFMKVINFVK